MKLTETKLRSIIREELSRITEAGAKTLGGSELDGMHPGDFLEMVAKNIRRETGRHAAAAPAGRTVGMGTAADVSESDVIVFDGRNRYVYITVEPSRSGISGVLRTSRGEILKGFGGPPSGENTPRSVAYQIIGALRDVGEA